jgi:NMD protein affecting ribosome stability and mRNA decay
MRSNKQYSNVAFTKRVDYDGGSHRPPRAPVGVRLCSHCGALYLKRRWVPKTDPRVPLLALTAVSTVCPACAMAAKHQFRGQLTIGGAFFDAHREEVERLLTNEAARTLEDNPLAQILEWDRRKPGTLIVYTSTEHLVERLGHALNMAFGGEIDYGFSHGNKLARGHWRRD